MPKVISTGVHPGIGDAPVRVAPSLAEEFNTVRAFLIPKACFKLEDAHFAFDSSFVVPEGFDVAPLKELLDKHPGAKLSIFGHADPTGDDAYNKTLAGRRASAIFGLLTRDVPMWDKLHDQPAGGDNWKPEAEQTMLATTGLPKGTARATLTKAYMDHLCTVRNSAGQSIGTVQLTKDDFLARGQDKAGKGDLQGCSEFNPLMIFSASEKAVLDQPANHAQRNAENQVNRRVMVLLFRPGSRVDPAKWPCPTVDEGTAKCLKRFHSDGATRRSNQAKRREFKDTKDTFACRFYDRLTNSSPCEVPPPPPVATLEIILDNNDNHAVDASEPVATFVRMGIWDHGWDPATGTLRNNEAEAQNFIGVDSVGTEARRFYFRVRDSNASGRAQVQLRWRTEFGAGGNDDAPGSQVITLLPTSDPEVFVSRAVFLVGDTTDRDQATNSGLPAANADAGSRNRGTSNHRIRKVTVDDAHQLDANVVAEYTPAAGGANLVVKRPLFNRAPDERRRIRVHLVNVRDAVGGTPVLNAARRRATSDIIRSIYATCGIFAEIDEIVIDPPASCINWSTRFPASGIAVGADPAVEESSFPANFLIPSPSQVDIINVIRARADFNDNDVYLVYVTRMFQNPIPAPGPAAVLQASGAGGEAFPDTWTTAGSVARSFAFLGVRTTNSLAEAHEMTHITTDLRNDAGGHFHLQANVNTGPGNIDGRNLMQRFVLIQNGNTADSKRLWDEDFTNAGLSPSTIPAQISAIRGSRFIRPL
jgi:hypothetical protein